MKGLNCPPEATRKFWRNCMLGAEREQVEFVESSGATACSVRSDGESEQVELGESYAPAAWSSSRALPAGGNREVLPTGRAALEPKRSDRLRVWSAVGGHWLPFAAEYEK